MGASKRDMEKKSREYEESYEYNEIGVANLLRDIYSMQESRWYNGDIDATAILIDLYSSLDSGCLTPRMRQVFALYYFAGLTEYELAEILGLDQSSVTRIKNKAIGRIASNMFNGQLFTKGDPYTLNAREGALFRWLDDVALSKSSIYELSGRVFDAINAFFVDKDEKAVETLRQRSSGRLKMTIESSPDDYVCLTEDQFKWKDRRMTFKPVIYPQADVVGTVKVAVRNEEDKQGVEWRVEKRKMFKVRGN